LHLNSSSQYFKIVSTSDLEMHICTQPSQKTWTEIKNCASSVWGLWGFTINET